MPNEKELRVKLTAEADTDKVEEFADALEEVPEKTEAKLEVDDGQTAQVIGDVKEDLEKLTAEEHTVRVSVDADAMRAAAGRAKASIDDIGKSAGSSKSVLANMVGNATQDLGALSGVAGSAGVAIGQMGEYMADAAAQGEAFGSIAGNFLKVAGPVAAISLGVGLLTTVFGNMAKSAEEAKKRAEEFAKAVEQSGGNVDAAFAKLAEAGNFDDLIDDLDRLGVSFEQFVELSKGGALAIDPVRADALGRIQKLDDLFRKTGAQKYASEIKDVSAELGLTAKQGLAAARSLEEIGDTAEKSGDQIQSAIDLYAQQRRVMQDNADVIDTVNEAVKRGIDVTGKSAEQLTRLMGQQDLQTQQQLDLNEAIARGNEELKVMAQEALAEASAESSRLKGELESLNAQLASMSGAILSQAESRVRLNDAQERYAELVADEKATTDERVVGAQNVAEAFAGVMGAIAEANGEPFDKNAAIINSLKATAEQADGPTKDAINNVVTALERVPPSTNTDMIVNNSQALAAINETRRLNQILIDELQTMRYIASTGSAALPPGVSTSSTGGGTHITVNAGFGTDVFAVRRAVLGASRQAGRLVNGSRAR